MQKLLQIFLVLSIITFPTFALAEPTAQEKSLFQAAKSGNMASLRQLVKTVDVNATDGNGDTALIFAAQKGHLAAITLLIDNGADIHVKGDWEVTPLMRAAEAGQLEAVKLLLANRADVRAKTFEGITALIIAAVNERWDIVRFLVDNRGHISLYYLGGNETLGEASGRGNNLEIVKLLVANGADVNSEDESSGFTPLLVAVAHNNLDIAEFLLKNGAETTAKTNYGKETALMIAQEKGFTEMVKLLKAHGAK